MKTMLALALFATILVSNGSPSTAQSDPNQQAQEVQIGRQVYDQLANKGEILHSSPFYAVLKPIAKQIKRVADRQYMRPFTFILVHEQAPNAFAVPGGNVYVTDSLMTFVENREELAGVLCHETSHTIHHDVIHNIAKDQRAERNTAIVATLANLLTGGRDSQYIGALANFNIATAFNSYSRPVETAADLKGSETCAQVGSNPWGMVWLFQRFEKANSGGQFEALSDHPTDDHRIEDLERHFASNPSLFAKFNHSITSAHKLPIQRVAAPNAQAPQ